MLNIEEKGAVRHKKSPINLGPPGLDEDLSRDLDGVKLIPPNDPKLVAAKRLLNYAQTAIQHSEEVQARSQEVQAKAKKLGKKLLKNSNGTS